MNLQRSGFTLIEISIALFISSMLALLLYRSFSDTQRMARNANVLMDVVAQMPIVYNQLEKDITTIFVPERVFRDVAKKANKKEGAVPAAQGIEDKEKKPVEPFKDIFVLSAKEKNLERMSFISTHSLALYNTVVPHAVRVVYRLVPTENPGIFTLVRQEATKLDMPLAEFKNDNVRAYDLMKGVKEFKIELLVPEKPELAEAPGEGKGQKPAPEKKPKKYSTLTKWESEGDSNMEYLIPAYINITGIFVDAGTGREYPFEWKFAVTVFDDVVVRVKKAQTKKPTTPEPKQDGAQPGDKKENKPNGPGGPGVPGKPVPPVNPIRPGL